MKTKETIEKKKRFKSMILGHIGYTLFLAVSIFYLLHLDKTVPAPNLFVGMFALMCFIALIVYLPISVYVCYEIYCYLFANEGGEE